ncbi:MAG: SprT-like domain-containing protein [Nitrospinae bacterium]|nr:SprT-like domain-containing protein [Nitrospinota bacterium]
MSIVEKFKTFLKKGVDVFFTDNRTTMIAVKRKTDGSYSVRLHNMFSEAGEDVIKAVSDYIEGKRRGSREIIRRFINDNFNKIKSLPLRQNIRPAARLYTAGRFFDLKEIFDKLNKEYFNGVMAIKITWGRGSYNSRRYIRFGSYTEKDDIIRIHPILDRQFIPDFFIESIVYHEMLHKLVKTRVENGRRRVHTPEFKEMEKRFRDYEKAKEWEKENIKRLLNIRT